jgi:hypothetical protein
MRVDPEFVLDGYVKNSPSFSCKKSVVGDSTQTPSTTFCDSMNDLSVVVIEIEFESVSFRKSVKSLKVAS